MAPRQSSGISSSYYGSSSCSEFAFETEASRVSIAFAALYFVVSVGLSWAATATFTKGRKHGQRVPGSWFLGFSIFFASGSYLCDIIYTTLSECVITDPDSLWAANLVGAWVGELSDYILTAIIMTTLCSKLQRDTNSLAMFTPMVNKVWVALLGALVLAGLSMTTAQQTFVLSTDTDYVAAADLQEPLKGVWMAYYTMSVAGILLAVAVMAKMLGSAPKTLKIWTLVLAACALGYTATSLGTVIESYFNYTFFVSASQYNEYIRKSEAASFLVSFFYSVAFYAALRVAGYRGFPKNQEPVGDVEYVQQPYGYAHGAQAQGQEQEQTFQNQIPAYEAGHRY